MKILHVLPGADPTGGAEQSFAATAAMLTEDGFDLHLAVLTDRQDLVPRLRDSGVTVHDLSSSSGRLRQAAALHQLIRRTEPDVVHAALWDAVFPTQLAAVATRTPVVVTWAAVGNAADHVGGQTWKHRVILQSDRALALASNSHFHAVTEGVAAANGRALAIRRDRVTVVHRGRPDAAATEPGTAERIRRELDIPQAATLVLAVGRQEPIKDHASLVRAIGLLDGPNPDVRLVIAGRDGAASTGLRDLVASSGLASRVQLLGHRDDVDDLLATADVFVSSSRSEGAAGSVIEAMRSAVPVVTTDVLGLRGLVHDGVNALVVPVGDPTALAGAIVSLATDGELAARIGLAGRATYDSTFRLDAAAAGMADLYRSVAASRRRRTRS